jgi:hypothetical protein
MATPPGSSFDEPAHYIKAIGVGRGDLRGQPPAPTRADLRRLFQRSAGNDPNLARLAGLLRRTPVGHSRSFHVPQRLLRGGFGCTYGRSGASARCLDEHRPAVRRRIVGTYVGTYQPYLYIPAGLAMRAARSPDAAFRLGRAATLLVSLGLLVTAVWLLWSPAAPGLSLLGLVAAVTPMVLFVSSVLSPSGPEIAGAVCFSAALLRLARREARPRWSWAGLGASGAVLAAARSLGPAFVALIVVSVPFLIGGTRFRSRARDGGTKALAAAIAILASAAAGLVWEISYQPHPSLSATTTLDSLGPSVNHLPEVAKQAVGVFGALDAPMPGAGYVLWLLLIASLAAAAIAVGSPRERASVLALAAAAVGVTLVMSMVVYKEIGPFHGRYALPLLVFVPLYLGEILLRRRARLGRRLRRSLVVGVFSVATAVQVLGWWASARRFAVGDHGSWLFFGNADWSPPLGWWPWLLAVAAAAATYAAAGLLRDAPGPR